MVRATQSNFDEFRHAIERIPPARYLASSYYERWLAAAETLLVERGVVTREELLAKEDASIDPASDRERGRDSAARLPSKTNPEQSRRARALPKAIACARAT